MRIAIYSHVSTSHQVEHQTVEQHFERLTAHAQAHAAEGWVLDPAHGFRDDGYSGATLAHGAGPLARRSEGPLDRPCARHGP
jgi:site-specific DNA recombinase